MSTRTRKPSSRSSPSESLSAPLHEKGHPAKRAAIVDAAKAVFLRDGFTRASVDTIAEEARVSKQTIYNHFGDKERLFFAVIEAVQGGAGPLQEHALDALFEEEARPSVVLRKIGQRLVSTLYRDDLAALRRLVIAESAHYPQLRLAWVRGGPLGFLIRMTGYLANEVQRGRLEIQKPERAARQLIALVSADANEQSVFGTVPLSAPQVEAIVDDAVEMFLRAYAPRPATPVKKGRGA